MSNTRNNTFQLPDHCYDHMVRSIRDGDSEEDKNFLKDHPYFTEEAMEKRRQEKWKNTIEKFKVELVEKFPIPQPK